MTRKRFIKLMMCDGVSRNCATALAQDVSRYGSYEAMYRFLYHPSLYENLACAMEGLSAAVESAASALRRIALCISKRAGLLPSE